MKSKNFLLGMLVIVLVFGMALVGCGKETDENPFEGEWIGNFSVVKSNADDNAELEAKITFTEDEWTLTDMTTGNTILSGTYTYEEILSVETATLFVDGYNKVATGTILLDTGLVDYIKITFNNGAYNGSGGNFKRVKEIQSFTFVGEWEGEFTPKEGQKDENATISFEEQNKWKLTYTTNTTVEGSYSKSSIGYRATLSKDSSEVGYGVYNPITKNLTVYITSNDNKGSGTFTKKQP